MIIFTSLEKLSICLQDLDKMRTQIEDVNNLIRLKLDRQLVFFKWFAFLASFIKILSALLEI